MVLARTADFLTISLSDIILVLCNTLILFLILKHFLFDKINKVIDDRKNDIAESYRKADEAEEQAKLMQQEYTEKLSSAKEESAEIVRSATQKAQLRSDEIIAEARNEAKGIVDRANDEIDREKKIAVNQMKDEIVVIALSAASAVVQKKISGEDDERLVESFIDSVGEQ